MAKLSMNELTTYRWSFEEDVQQYASAGYRAIGVWRQKLSDYGEEKGAELLHEFGLAVSSLLWAGGFTGSDGRSHREAIDDALEAVRTAAIIQAETLVVYSGARAGHTSNHARRLLKTAFDELLPAAEDAGVVLVLEPMHPGCATDCTFLTDLDEAMKVIDELESPYLKLAFDAYHLGHDDGLIEQLPRLAPSIGLVQFGDARHPPQGEQNRCPLGEGGLQLREMLRALRHGGYVGYIEVELLGEDIATSDYRELVGQSKKMLDELLAD